MRKIFNKLKFRTTLLLVAFVTVGAVAGLSIYLWFMVKNLSTEVSLMYDGPLMSSSFAQSSRVNFLKYDASVRKSILCQVGEESCNLKSTVFDNHIESMISDLDVVSERSQSEANLKIVKDIKNNIQEVESFRKDLFQKKQSGLLPTDILGLWENDEHRKLIEENLLKVSDNEAELGFERSQNIKKKSASNLQTSMIVLALGIGLSFLVSFFSASVVTSPISQLAKVCLSFAKGDYAARAEVNGSPEIRFLGDSFNEMAAQVENRNQQLKIENQKTSNLLNNMRQSIFSVGADGKIIGPVSKYSEVVFGEPIEGRHINEVLYKDILKKLEIESNLKTAYAVVFGGTELQWIFMENVFPKRVIRHVFNDNAKKIFKEQILKVGVTPLWDDQAVVEKLMYIVEDVTEVEFVARQAALEKERSEKNIRMLQELLHSKRIEVKKFFVDFFEMLSELYILSSKSELSKEDLDLMSRYLHTLKGNSRVFKLSSLTEVVYDVEDQYQKIRSEVQQPRKNWGYYSLDFITVLNNIKETYDSYLRIYDELFDGTQVVWATDGFIEKDRLKDFIHRIDGILAKEKPYVSSLIRAELSSLILTPILEVMKSFQGMVEEISKECEKKVNYVCSGEDFGLKEHGIKLVKDAVMHILRNSIDHGIESTAQRLEIGKSAEGLLQVHTKIEDGICIISIKDDGRGMDSEMIASSAIKKGLITAEKVQALTDLQKIELIFTPGFSTRDKVTEISGRGVGMDVVAANIKELNGTIEIHTQVGHGTEFKLIIPQEHSMTDFSI